MKKLSFKGYRFPPDIIRNAVWLYFRFSLSLRDVEELLAQRGVDVSYETVRCWTIKFGPLIARRLRKLRPGPSPRWHLDEMVWSIGGKRMYLWRAVDDEGEILDVIVQARRDKVAAVKLPATPVAKPAGQAGSVHHGRSGVIRCSPWLVTPTASASARAAARKQQGRGLTSAYPKTRAEHAALQEPSLHPTLPHYPRRRLQYLLHPTSPHQPCDAPDL